MTPSRHASPWDALLRVQRHRSAPAQHHQPAARTGTKLAGLLDLLRERDSATTLTLSVCADLTPRQVWGLLKQPRVIGQVHFEAGRWSLREDFPGHDVQRAIKLLQDRGYVVEAPRP